MKENRKCWTSDEDQIILGLVRKYGVRRWTFISQKMKQRFPEQGRTGKQCRQRWHNHLSPIINKSAWSEQQMKTLFDEHRKNGNKWTQIAALLPGRTDNAVKNQFYSTLRKSLRRIYKVLGTRNSTSRIKKLKPTVLSNTISKFGKGSPENSQEGNQLYSILFEFSHEEKYEEMKQKQVNLKYRQKLQSLLQKVLASRDETKNSQKRIRKKNKSHLLMEQKISNSSQIKDDLKKGKQQLPPLEGLKSRQSLMSSSSYQSADQSSSSLSDNPIEKDNRFQFNIEICQPRESESVLFEDGDSALEKPISLRKDNSYRDEEIGAILLKKTSSDQNYEMDEPYDQNYNFFVKSPAYGSSGSKGSKIKKNKDIQVEEKQRAEKKESSEKVSDSGSGSGSSRVERRGKKQQERREKGWR